MDDNKLKNEQKVEFSISQHYLMQNFFKHDC